MKLICILFLILNFKTFAAESNCPQLAADYYCMFDYGGTGELTISQTLNTDGFTVYEYNLDGTVYTYTADSIWRSLGDSGSMKGQKEKISCGENTKIDDFSYHSSDLSRVTTLQFIHKLDVAGNVDGSYTKILSENEKDDNSAGTFFCQRMN